MLGWSKAKVSRYELSQGGLKPTDVARLLDVYGVEDRRREQLLALAHEATLKGWWESYSDVLAEGHMAFIALEAEATGILEWHINVIPGLLQTEQYAREILSGYNQVATISPRAIERRLETRLIRQQRLAGNEPLDYVGFGSAFNPRATIRRLSTPAVSSTVNLTRRKTRSRADLRWSGTRVRLVSVSWRPRSPPLMPTPPARSMPPR